MSYDDHTDCRFCRRHSVDCWCYSTNLWTDEAKDDQSAWCHRPDDPSAHVPAAPWGQRLDEAYRKLDQAFLDAMPVEPRARVIPDDGDVMGRIRDAYKLIESAPPRRTEPIKLTEQQITTIRRQQPEKSPLDLGVVADLIAVPIVKVDTVEESTPYLEARRPGGIVNIPRRMTDAEFEQFERRWRKKHSGTHNAHRVKLLGRHPWPWWKRAYYQVRRWLA